MRKADSSVGPQRRELWRFLHPLNKDLMSTCHYTDWEISGFCPHRAYHLVQKNKHLEDDVECTVTYHFISNKDFKVYITLKSNLKSCLHEWRAFQAKKRLMGTTGR